ncbi:MAG: PKD domain-containing protein [Methanomassiliicoccales archaeon]|nr:PKD domain-containing protein [Methanomassiliicoccales archaeon]
MKKMGAVGLLVFLLVVSIPATVSVDSPARDLGQSAVEYASTPLEPDFQFDPNLIFQEGVVFDYSSNVIASGTGAREFELGDLNNDALTDAAIISNVTNDIRIFNGTSTGEFDENPWRIQKADMVDLRDIAIGDLDGDGLNDFAVSHLTGGGGSRLTIFYQVDGFAPDSNDTLMTDTQPFEIVIGEFSGDSQNDIAVVCRGSQSSIDDYVTVWKQPFQDFADKTQVAIPGLTRSELLSLGMVNSDNRIDLVVANRSGTNAVVLYQPASFVSPVNPWPTKSLIIVGAITDIEIANLTGIGARDLAVANSGLSRVQLYYNTGSDLPNSWSAWIPASPGSFSVAFGEISGDDSTDMVVLSNTGSNASVHFQGNTDNWYSTPNYTFPTNSGPVRALINETKEAGNDIIVLSRGEAGIGGGLEQFFASVDFIGNANLNLFPFSSPYGLASGSVETEKMTVAASLSSLNEIAVFELGSQRKNQLFTENAPGAIDFGTLNADESDDIVVANRLSNSVSVFLGSSGIYTQKYPFLNVTTPSLTALSSIICASLGQTSLDSIIVGGNGGLVILNNTGVSPFFSPSDFEIMYTGLPGNATEIYVGEFNGQGSGGDIAVLTRNSSMVQLFFRSPTGSWNNYYTLFPSANLTAGPTSVLNSMAIGDFDGDGRDDFCTINSTARAFVFTQPIGGFTQWQPYDYAFDLREAAEEVRSADLNDDGEADLVVSCKTPVKLSIYLNHGSGIFIDNMNFTSGGAASDLIAEDIDGDGRADLASSAAASFSLSIWFQNNLVPLAEASASKYTENEGVDITFDGSGSTDSYSDRSTLQYYWSFGDGDNDNGLTALHRFLDNGGYSVSLRVTDRGGLTNYSNITVTIADASPTASFTPPQNPVEGVQVIFTDASISYPDQIVNWTWDFDDGEKAYTKNPTYTYMQDGNYDVQLTVVDEDGSDDSKTMVVEVADVSPRADFAASSLSPMENTTVYFNDTSYSYPDPIATYGWTFGDGAVASDDRVSHVYAQNGSYNVTLTITDSDGSLSTFWRIVQVQDSVPTTSFGFSPAVPLEGQDIIFTDISSAYDGLVSWGWDFGDGDTSDSQNPSHSYDDNGSYEVTLVTYDGDQSPSQMKLTITVLDTSPTILSLTTQSGLTSFEEDESVTFSLTTSLAWESIKRYEWNFSYSSGFVVDITTLVNHVTHSFPQSGSYMVVVRVWDSDSYDDKSLWIDVINVPPTADFQNETPVNGYVTFYASYSTDTPHDVPLLNYRWNFDDGSGWGAWSSSTIINHTFSETREYDITLEVRDDDGAIARITKELIISGPDDLNPSISDVVTPQNAVIGKPITVFANVTDNSGYVEAYLRYRIGNKTEETLMILVSGITYQGQIPSQNSTVKITCWIEARDYNGNNYTVGPFEIVVQEVVPAEYWAAGFGGAAFLLAGMFLGFRRYHASVDEAFIIYEDGRLIAHHTRHLKPGMDDEVLSSMLIAIQDFVKDSFKDERATALKRLDFGEKKILVEKGERVYLAAVLHGKHAGKIPQKMLQVIEEIQKDFGPTFAQWDGDLESVRGVKDEAQVLFKKQWSISRIIPIWKPIEEKGPLMTECPVCDQQIPADSKKCPSCGADFGSASVADLEKVAQDLLKEKDGTQSVADETPDHQTKDDEGPQD